MPPDGYLLSKSSQTPPLPAGDLTRVLPRLCDPAGEFEYSPSAPGCPSLFLSALAKEMPSLVRQLLIPAAQVSSVV